MVSEILSDQYGNYVIQKALQVSEGLKFLSIIQVRNHIIFNFKNIIQLIKPRLKSLKYSSQGKKIYDTLVYNYGEYLCYNNEKRNSSFQKSSAKN